MNISNKPCPRVLDTIGRPVNAGDYILYRPGGGAVIRIGKVTQVYLEEERTLNGSMLYQLKVKSRVIALYEFRYTPKPRGSTIQINNYSDQAHPNQQFSKPIEAICHWDDCLLIEDPQLLNAITSVIP